MRCSRRYIGCSRTPQVENGFGTTEAGPAVFGPHPDGLPRPPLSLGYPLADIGCKLIDGDSDDQGILALRTPALMHGYLNQPQATASRMRDGWYVTGDVMRKDANGFYFFVGRADDMFVCGGENIYPGEVEKLLERHAGRGASHRRCRPPTTSRGRFRSPSSCRAAARRRASRRSSNTRCGKDRHTPTRDSSNSWSSLPLSGTHKIDRSSLTAEAARIVHAAGRST